MAVHKISKADKRLIIGSLIAAAFWLLLLSKGEEWFWGGGLFSDRPVVATLMDKENDARHRSKDNLTWLTAKSGLEVRAGDSLFAGSNSHLDVKLDKGAQMTIGENSLVVFSQINNESVLNVLEGNFRLTANGRVKIALQGELAEIDGQNSEVQIFIDKTNKPVMKLLKGNKVSIKTASGKTTNLDTKKDVSLAKTDLTSTRILAEAKVTPYTWHYEELYQTAPGSRLIERSPRPKWIKRKFVLDTSSHHNDPVDVQVANEPKFDTPWTFHSSESAVSVNKVYVGDNFWRITRNGKTWTAPQKLTVEASLLKDAEPRVEMPETVISMEDDKEAYGYIRLDSPVPALGFVGQISISESFLPDQSRAFWLAKAKHVHHFKQSGIYYFRFRTVSKNHEISDWSPPQRVEVNAPVPHIMAKELPEKERKIASVQGTEKLEVEMEADEPINKNYRKSQASALGFLWTMQSSDQYTSGEAAPISAGAGVNILHWIGSHGFEGKAKTAAMGLNEAGAKNSIQDFEGRYYYRFITKFPFGLARQLQTALFAGYETYQNSGAYFLSNYSLMKAGLSFNFPLWMRWSTGGEFVYGVSDSSGNKKEISGHLDYFWDEQWSLGLGYRIHLYDSPTSPSGSEEGTREGYTEGFSAIQYSY